VGKFALGSDGMNLKYAPNPCNLMKQSIISKFVFFSENITGFTAFQEMEIGVKRRHTHIAFMKV
jgi:hypothetical protein